MRIVKTFLKNYNYGSFIAVLSYNSVNEPKKAYLNYFKIKVDGTSEELNKMCKETQDLERMARKFINSQDYFILWSY